MKYCANPQCARENDDDANFCVYCRTPFNPAAAVETPSMAGEAAFSGDQAYGAAGSENASADEALRSISSQVAALVVRNQSIEAALEEQQKSTAALCEQLQGLEKTMQDLSARFDAKVARNEYEATILKSMSDEIQQYRDDLYEKLTLPLIRDLIEARNALSFIQNRHGGASSTKASIAPKEIAAVQTMLSDNLARNNVQVEQSRPGDDLLSFKHRVVGEVATSDESLVGKVAAVVNESYRLGDKYISPAMVKVYVPEKPAE